MSERLSILEFGSRLIRSGDLDPVYIALHRQRWPREQLCRWLIGYWSFYHCGVASWLSERPGHDFWPAFGAAAVNEAPSPVGGRWPRGRERRHFRGKAAVDAWVHLHRNYPEHPEEMVELIVGKAPSYKAVANQVRIHTGFGPWIAFKVADMVDRVLDVKVDFDTAAVFMFKDPTRAAVMYWNGIHGLDLEREYQGDYVRGTIIPSVTKGLIKHFSAHEPWAPPRGDRPINLQEVEKILCKWKAHQHGHYPVGLDTREIREGIEPWTAVSRAAAQFLKGIEPGAALNPDAIKLLEETP
jgi:hypothetical protein